MLSTSMGGEYINDYSYDCGIKPYVNALASRIPTPGGGSASAVCASIGLATGTMSAVYTKPKKEKPSLDAAALSNLAKKLQEASFHSLVLAQRDEEAFTALERTWKKDNDISRTEVELIKKQALDVPLELFNHSYKNIVILDEFLPKCSKNIISDAKVSIHLLCGSARAAFQTVLVNKPSVELTKDLQAKLKQIEKIESGLIQ
eukprot:CAMPEP_0204838726 /NCGR_PEP_ID=MMETSP1346-20131115/31709_1 /ASSEMBLY_ACC=CAM_ASM_000771 /TAXON_ID=215587 /ORGANISM="Aplanochytrium stocchinoi, Strain GSBS06" /LENGTH=202 /DNA_ID=CAMNT_0051974939 /DNA_START=182 /DNA_END=790 /DNA_ORIENTATION=+